MPNTFFEALKPFLYANEQRTGFHVGADSPWIGDYEALWKEIQRDQVLVMLLNSVADQSTESEHLEGPPRARVAGKLAEMLCIGVLVGRAMERNL